MHRRTRCLPLVPILLILGCPDDTPPGSTTEGDSTAGDAVTGSTTSPSTTTVEPTTADGSTGTSAGSSSTTEDEDDEIEVEVDGTLVESGETVVVPGSVDVGAMGEVIVVRIRNIGGMDLTVSSASFDGGDVAHFALDDSMLDPVVPSAGTTALGLAFTPQNGGRKIAQLVIDNSDGDEGTFTIDFEARTTPNTYRDVLPTSIPAARFNHGMTGLGDDRAVLFGGRLAAGGRADDTWVFEGELGEWTELSPAVSPSARDTPALAPVGDGLVLLFGGTETSGPSPNPTPQSDTWLLDLATGEWTELVPPVSPPGRYQHAMVGLSDGTALLYGGRMDFGLELSDTWVFDLAAEEWSEVPAPTGPGPRSAFAMASDGIDRVVMTGGSLDSASFVDETWVFELGAGDWTMGAAAGTGARFNHDLVWLEGGPLVTVSGKTNCCSDPVPGTWAYDADADAWAELSPDTDPLPRFSYGIAHLGRDKAIVFGGLTVNADPLSATSQTLEYVGP